MRDSRHPRARLRERAASPHPRSFALPFHASSQVFNRAGSAAVLAARRPERVCLSSLTSPPARTSGVGLGVEVGAAPRRAYFERRSSLGVGVRMRP